MSMSDVAFKVYMSFFFLFSLFIHNNIQNTIKNPFIFRYLFCYILSTKCQPCIFSLSFCSALTLVVTTFIVVKATTPEVNGFVVLEEGLLKNKSAVKQVVWTWNITSEFKKFAYLCMWVEQAEGWRLESECSTNGAHYLKALCRVTQNVDERESHKTKTYTYNEGFNLYRFP